MKYLLTVLILFITAIACSAMPLKVKDTLMWDPVISNTDGSQATDLLGYKVYWTTESGVYNDRDSLSLGLVTSIYLPTTLSGFKGLHCFVVTAFDESNNESDFSNEICDMFPAKKSTPSNTRLLDE